MSDSRHERHFALKSHCVHIYFISLLDLLVALTDGTDGTNFLALSQKFSASAKCCVSSSFCFCFTTYILIHIQILGLKPGW